MRILVVEDDNDLRELFRDFLCELGHEPQVARSAEAALAMLRVERPDVILLDLRLPGMSGLDFLQLGWVRESRVPVIGVSGVATEEEARRCLQLGAVHFVPKPVFFERLSDILECFEPYARAQTAVMAGRLLERRRSPRVAVTLPVQVLEYTGAEWQARSLDLSVSGMKLQPVGPARPGRIVKLSWGPQAEAPYAGILSLRVRSDLGGFAFHFVNLTEGDAERLSDLVRRLTLLAHAP